MFASFISALPCDTGDIIYSPGGALDYVPWDIDVFMQSLKSLMQFIGPAFNIGIQIFCIVGGVYLVLNIVGGIGR